MMKTPPLISVLHPTCRLRPYPSFPDAWRGAMLQWFTACADPSAVEYVLSVHASRWEEFQRSYGAMTWPRWGSWKVIRNDGLDTNVSQVNCAAAASSGRLLAVTMDDLDAPANWDARLVEAVPDLGQEWVIHCSTGSPRDWEPLINAGCSTRARYQRFGYHVWPEYESMYADNDFTEVAYREGRVLRRPDIVFNHRHPAFGTAKPDEMYALENRTEAYRSGRRVFTRRRLEGFPAEYRPAEPAPAAGDRAALPHPSELIVAQCLPGESFSAAWVGAAFSLLPDLLKTFGGFYPVMTQSSNVYAVRYDLAEFCLHSMAPRPDVLLWVDDDNPINLAHVLQLLETLYKYPDAGIVAGWCYATMDNDPNPNPGLSCGLIPGGTAFKGSEYAGGRSKQSMLAELAAAPGDVVERDYTGFPVLLMRTAALEAAGGERAFIPIVSNIFERGFSGEDFACCVRLKNAGWRIYVDRRVKVPHLKLGSPEPAPAPAVAAVPVPA